MQDTRVWGGKETREMMKGGNNRPGKIHESNKIRMKKKWKGKKDKKKS